MRRPLLTRPTAVLLAAAAIAGCGRDQSRGGEISGNTLTIYSSLPLQGPHRRQAESIIKAEKLALREAGGKAGAFGVNFVSVDDALAAESGEPGWSPARTADNARKAAQDSRTIAYLGEFDSSASGVSLPITNEAGFVQVSPASTAVGLTKLVPGADKGEPDKFYPSGERTFARVVPADDVQASAAARWARALGARTVFLIDDKGVEGRGLVEQFREAALRGGLSIAGQESMDPRATDYRELAQDIARKDPDAVYFGGGVQSNALRLWRDLRSSVPGALLMGSDRLAVPEFYRRIGGAAGRTYVVSAAQDPAALPPRGRRFVRAYRRQFGERPDRYAAYGHAAMSLLLDVIRRAGDRANQRAEIVDGLLDTREFPSAVGSFSLDSNGDTTLERVAGYRVRRGRLVFVRSLRGVATG